jgi:DNA-directed RNA polymerase specialized sigma24 family protein
MTAPKRSDPSVGGRVRGIRRAPAHSAVRGTIAAMQGRARLVLALHFYERLGTAEIARTLGAPVGDIERLLDQGKAELTRVVAPRDSKSGGSGTHAA